MTEIKDILIEKNPWWKRKFDSGFKEREIYKQIQKFVPLKQIIALTGLRRVGKTTIMNKIVEDSIKSGFDSRNIIYFSFDDFNKSDIREIIKSYESIMGKDFGNEKCLLLLDEVQKLSSWEENVKSIYDSFGKNVKIIISGSESLFIRQKSKESLGGRIFEFKIGFLNFMEFLIFKDLSFQNIRLYERELSRLFQEFILTSGFPELIGIKEKDIIKKYIIEGIIEKIVYRDIPQLFKVKDPSVIRSILNIIMEQPGQIIELSELSKDIGISRQTLSNYLSYLEDSFLIRKLYNFSKNKRKIERKLKKYYPAIISPDMLFREDSLSRSKVFEWIIVNQLNAEFFWRDPYKNEVDIILADRNSVIPVEVKYGKLDFSGLMKFMEKFKIRNGFIVSLDKEEEKIFAGKKILVVPAVNFLLKPPFIKETKS